MLGGEAVIGDENPGPGRRRERAGMRLVAERRADHVAAAVEVEHGRPVARAGGDDQRRHATRGHGPRDRACRGRELRHSTTRTSRGSRRGRGRWRACLGAARAPARPAPINSPPTDSAAATASSTSRSNWRERSSRASPASVSSTLCVERRSSSQPTSCSRPRICLLKAGCETYSRSAARPKFSSSATATNARRCRNSMPSGAWGKGRTLAR